MTTAPAVWYLMRASGVVALLLLTVAFGLGVATSNRWKPRAARLWVTTAIHRSASLLSVSFVAVHVSTAAIDPDAAVHPLAIVWPLGNSWSLAAGTLSLDLLAALVITSLGRRRLSFRAWRAIHWTAYAAWPLAVAHGLGMGTDVGAWWLQAVTIACIAAMGGVVTWRFSAVPASP
jgi:sulfoxide reductase heme-binding subunit YedZ